MKKILCILIVACCLPVIAAAADNNVALADSAYEREHYQEALQRYLYEVKNHGTSSDLFYNIGNTYYRMRDNTHAILYYERALQLDPSNSDARENLDFVREKAHISEDTGASFFSDFFESLVRRESSNTWAVIAAVSFILFLAAVALYLFVDQVALRKIGFFGGGVLLLATVLAVASALYLYSQTKNQTQAIVMVPSSTLSTAPHAPSTREVAFSLAQGHKVLIQDSVVNNSGVTTQQWYRVETADDRSAWINAADIEKI